MTEAPRPVSRHADKIPEAGTSSGTPTNRHQPMSTRGVTSAEGSFDSVPAKFKGAGLLDGKFVIKTPGS
jgi:hypothetical protein